MAIEVSRTYAEVLGKSPVSGNVTRMVGDVIVVENSSVLSDIEVTRMRMEVAGQLPEQAAVTRMAGDVIVADDGPAVTADIEVTRMHAEVAGRLPPKPAVTRMAGDVIVADNDPVVPSTLEVTRTSMEVAGRNPVTLEKGTLPANLEFFSHNWADGVTLTSTYQTDVCRSPLTLTEDRTGLANKPARRIKVEWLLGKEDSLLARTQLNDFMISLRRAVREDGAIPLYSDVVLMENETAAGATTIVSDFSKRRLFTNSLIVIVHMDHACRPISFQYTCITSFRNDQIVIGDPLANDIQRCRAVVMPVMLVHKSSEIEMKHITEHVTSVSVQFDEIYGPFALPPVAADTPGLFRTYLGHPILGRQPNRAETLRVQFMREGARRNLGRGLSVECRGERHLRITKLPFTNERRDGRGWEMIEFWDTRLGRLRPFWQIEYENVWRVSQINAAGFISINPLGDFAEFSRDLDTIGLVFKDGTEFVSNVVNIQDLAGEWRVTIDIANTTLPVGLGAADVKRVGRAYLARNRSDSVTEQWTTDEVVSLQIDTIELLNEVDVTLDP